jgi:membrane protein implicated in regulation of membrane protease activity
MISILIILAVFCLVAYLVDYLTRLPGVPPPVRVIAYAVLTVVAIVWLIQFLPGGLHLGRIS